MITHPILIVVLIAIEGLVLELSRHARTMRYFDLPQCSGYISYRLTATFGLITSKNQVYGMITTWPGPTALRLKLQREYIL